MGTWLYERLPGLMVRWRQREKSYARQRRGLGCSANTMFEVKTVGLSPRFDWKSPENRWRAAEQWGWEDSMWKDQLGMASLGQYRQIKSRSQFWSQRVRTWEREASHCCLGRLKLVVQPLHLSSLVKLLGQVHYQGGQQDLDMSLFLLQIQLHIMPVLCSWSSQNIRKTIANSCVQLKIAGDNCQNCR